MMPAAIADPAPTTIPVVGARGAGALAGLSLVFPLMMLSSAFQAAGRPLWPLLANVSRALVVAGGGALVIHATDTGLTGLALVAAAGVLVYGATVAVAFRTGAWRGAGTKE
jgi:Na+-driven multidrug efflux pump